MKLNAKIGALALAATSALISTPASAINVPDWLKVGLASGIGWSTAYGSGQVAGAFVKTDSWGIGLGFLSAAICSVPTGAVSWFSNPSWFGGGPAAQINLNGWDRPTLVTVWFKFISVGAAGTACNIVTRGFYNSFRGWGYLGSQMGAPVKGNFTCPADWTCEPRNPPPPARRRLLQSSISAQMLGNMQSLQAAFNSYRSAYYKDITATEQQVRCGRDNECIVQYAVQRVEAVQAKNEAATKGEGALENIGFEARSFATQMGLPRWPAWGH